MEEQREEEGGAECYHSEAPVQQTEIQDGTLHKTSTNTADIVSL